MGHNLSAILTKTPFDEDRAKAYDLLAIPLDFGLNMFPITHYYTAYWQKKLNASGYLPGGTQDLLFPSEKIIHTLITEITKVETPLYAVFTTEYFGGTGKGWARVYQGTQLADANTSINKVLAFLGVIKQSGKDEFDTLGLSRYRRPPDYLERYEDLA